MARNIILRNLVNLTLDIQAGFHQIIDIFAIWTYN